MRCLHAIALLEFRYNAENCDNAAAADDDDDGGADSGEAGEGGGNSANTAIAIADVALLSLIRCRGCYENVVRFFLSFSLSLFHFTLAI